MVNPTSYIPLSSESETEKLDTESEVTRKLGSWGFSTSQAMAITAVRKRNSRTKVKVSFWTKRDLLVLLEVLMVEGGSMSRSALEAEQQRRVKEIQKKREGGYI